MPKLMAPGLRLTLSGRGSGLKTLIVHVVGGQHDPIRLDAGGAEVSRVWPGPRPGPP